MEPEDRADGLLQHGERPIATLDVQQLVAGDGLLRGRLQFEKSNGKENRRVPDSVSHRAGQVGRKISVSLNANLDLDPRDHLWRRKQQASIAPVTAKPPESESKPDSAQGGSGAEDPNGRLRPGNSRPPVRSARGRYRDRLCGNHDGWLNRRRFP